MKVKVRPVAMSDHEIEAMFHIVSEWLDVHDDGEEDAWPAKEEMLRHARAMKDRLDAESKDDGEEWRDRLRLAREVVEEASAKELGRVARIRKMDGAAAYLGELIERDE